MPAAIEVRGLVRRFGSRTALDGIDLVVPDGDLHGLIGPNGAGKTTTLRCICGLVGRDTGSVEVRGADPEEDPRQVRDVIGLMPQEHCLYGDLSIGENLSFFGRLFGLDRKTFRDRTARLMEITRLGPFWDRRASKLSGGMYKKLALSCALLHRPPMLLLDEPTNGVDPVSRRELWDLLYELGEEGTTVLVATAYLDEAERCHRTTLLSEGRVVATGEPFDLTREVGASSFEEAFLIYTETERGSDR
ncbi:MAG: ABC transporter ATP-binding protein [Myxococcota bacterium]